MQQQAGIRRTIAIVLAFIVLVVYGFIWRMNQPVIMNDEQLRVNGAIESIFFLKILTSFFQNVT